MSALITDYGLSIVSPLVNDTAANFRLPSWPPPADFPVVIDVEGTVVSKFGDSVWDLSVWADVPKIINFGDGVSRKNEGKVSLVNAATFRMIVAWWLWGPRGVFAAGTLVSQHRSLKSIFVVCSSNNIDAKTISRYPAIIAKIALAISPSARLNALSLLHALYEQRDQLGFTLMDRQALSQLAKAFPPPARVEQTAYIPPRIWTYQIKRLRAVLDDFLSHKERVEGCYNEVLGRYIDNYGSLPAAIGNPNRRKLTATGAFEQLARDFGIYELLSKWYQKTPGRKQLPLSALTNYLSLVNRAGFAYLLNFSLMRVQEAWTLRANCFHIEHDERLGEIAMLRGETTKTIADDDARWITSPAVAIAVDSMKTISTWRMRLKAAYGGPSEDAENFLYLPTCEPWKVFSRIRSSRGMYPSYASIFKDYPKLFEESEIRVTQEDWELAKLITPTLDEETFGVGKIWRFTWHQLRRTGAVNMQASGLVSDFSLQYQLKHNTVAMSLYYGQGYSRLALNRNAKEEYIRSMYEMVGKEMALLLSDRFVSPYGDDRKRTLVKVISESDNKKLLAAAKSGRVSWRGTLLGGCTKSGPCEYGGVDNVVRCGGGDHKAPCADALFDRDRIHVIQRLHKTLSEQLKEAETDSPYHLSLQAQLRATENALNVLANK